MEFTEACANWETAHIAIFDPRKLFQEDGSPNGLTDLDDDSSAFIGGVDMLEEFAGSGKERQLVGYAKKYKIADNNAALNRASKILTMQGKEPAPQNASLTVLLMCISSSTHSTFPPLLDDPDRMCGAQLACLPSPVAGISAILVSTLPCDPFAERTPINVISRHRLDNHLAGLDASMLRARSSTQPHSASGMARAI